MAGKRFTVDAVFRGINKISKPVRSMGRSISNFVRESNTKIDKLGRRFLALGKIIGKTIAKAAVIGVVALGVAMADTAVKGAVFEQTMVSAAAKFPGLIRKGTKEYEALENAAKEIGKTTEFTATQSAGAINFLAMAGFDAAQSIAALPGVVDLATAASLDLARATDIATDTLGAFGLSVKDPIKLAKNLARVNDVLAKTTTSANTDMEQLFESIAAGAADFKTAGQSIESFAALTGIMANAGKKGEAAGTVLRNVMVRLAAPTGEAADMLKKMGIRTQDQSGNFRDVVDILADFEKGLEGLGTAQRTATISTIFGLRAQGGINILLEAGSKKIAEFRDGLLGAKGASTDMATAMRDTVQGRFNSLMSAIEGVQLTIFSLIKGPLSGILEKFTDVTRGIDAFILANTDATGSFTLFRDEINTVIDVLKIIWAVGEKAFEWLMWASPFLKPFVATLLIFKTVLIAVALATKVWAIAQGILNAVMTANPISIIIIAIAALVAGIVLLIDNWDAVVAAIKTGAESIWNWFSGLLDNPFFAAFGAIFLPFITIPALIIKHWEPIKAFFTSIWDGLVSGFEGAMSIISETIKKIENIPGVKSVMKFMGLEKGEEKTTTKPVTPQERLSRSIEENTDRQITETENNSTLTIRDKTGRAELSKQKRGGPRIALATSGGL